MKLETLLTHLSKHGEVEEPYGASHFPIYQTATFDLKKQQGKQYDYSRIDNPTRLGLETVLKKAESAAGVILTNSGVSALSLLFESVLKQNDTILVEKDLYGGTLRLLKNYKEKYNINAIFADFSNPSEMNTILKKNKIRLVHCESPTNPGLKVLDLKQIAVLAKDREVLFSVDNSLATFATQKPLDLGADFVVTSTTKYISGHGAVISGYVAAKSHKQFAKVKYQSAIAGKALSPMDCHTISLGLSTLTLRLRQHEKNALKMAKFFSTLPQVKEVTYPGLKSHPNHQLARQQMQYFPGVLLLHMQSVELAEHLIEHAELFGEKASFGTSDSRMEIPAKISHASFSEAELAQIGIYPSTIRVSIGLEAVSDLKKDVINALEKK